MEGTRCFEIFLSYQIRGTIQVSPGESRWAQVSRDLARARVGRKACPLTSWREHGDWTYRVSRPMFVSGRS